MSSFEESVKIEQAKQARLDVKRQAAARRIANKDQVLKRKLSERSEGTDIKILLGDQTDLAIDFIETMSDHGMPGARLLYTESVATHHHRTFRQRIFSRAVHAPHSAQGAPVYGYQIGTMSGESSGSVYLCEDQKLRAHLDITEGKYVDFDEPRRVHDLPDSYVYSDEATRHKAPQETSTITLLNGRSIGLILTDIAVANLAP